MRFFTMTKTVTKNLLAGPATLMYPARKRSFPEGSRGRVEVGIESCVFCGICSKRCPTYAIEVAKDARQWRIDRLKCCACNLCVEVCPKDALTMGSRYAPPATERDGGIVVVAGPAPVSAPAPAAPQPVG